MKFHTTLLKDSHGHLSVVEVSMCRDDCPDFEKPTDKGVEIRVSGGEINLSTQHHFQRRMDWPEAGKT